MADHLKTATISSDPEAVMQDIERSTIPEDLRHMRPAIEAIYDQFPEESEAAPKLRALAIKHRARRYRVFAAYRLIAQQRRADSETTED